jgi:hypothetical protein
MTSMSEEERLELTRGILNMLDDWEIEAKDQLVLLGLNDVPSREVKRLGNNRPLPDEPEVMQRVEHLICIADAMHKPHRKFRQRSPVATMVEDGMVGIISVRSYLDCSFSWDLTGSKA